MQTIKIYTLRDPLTHEIAYVGKTSKTLTERLEQHIYCATGRGRKNGKTPRDKWIRRLARCGARPVIEILETVTGDWQERETYWIKYYNSYKAKSNKLKNATIGGLGVRKNEPL
jgi:hypothetical protein